jgi:hypothetical protein
MHRSTIRFLAFVVLALLGAPVAMHVVVHDLHDHYERLAMVTLDETGHGEHEHPVVSSPAPQVPNLTRVALPDALTPSAAAVTRSSITTSDRNVFSFGALRIDDDVGLQPLLSTYLI